jgi:hypothetical protein
MCKFDQLFRVPTNHLSDRRRLREVRVLGLDEAISGGGPLMAVEESPDA